MKNRKSKRKRHIILNVSPNQKVTVFDIFSRFDIELTVVEKGAGRLALDFFIPGSIRIAK